MIYDICEHCASILIQLFYLRLLSTCDFVVIGEKLSQQCQVYSLNIVFGHQRYILIDLGFPMSQMYIVTISNPLGYSNKSSKESFYCMTLSNILFHLIFS